MTTGERFGRLTFTGNTERRGKRKRQYGEFVCDCGVVKLIRIDGVMSGCVISCGCRYNERKNTVGLNSVEYELLYNVWRNMVRRCEDEDSERYYTYGARGVRVCEEWHNFRAYAKWAVDSGWKCGLSIERKNLNGGYCPENCAFITMKEQAVNKTSNIRLVIKGENKCLSEWCREFDFPFKTAWSRYHRLGYRDPETIFYPGDLRRRSVS